MRLVNGDLSHAAELFLRRALALLIDLFLIGVALFASVSWYQGQTKSSTVNQFCDRLNDGTVRPGKHQAGDRCSGKHFRLTDKAISLKRIQGPF